MLKSETLLAARPSANLAAAAEGSLLDPDGLIVQSDTPSTSWGAGLLSDAIGLRGTAQTFRALSAAQNAGFMPTVGMRLLLRVPWTLTTQSAGAATRGSIVASLLLNGAVVATATGAVRNLNSQSGTRFTEIIDMVMTTTVTMSPGTLVEVRVQPQVTVASGTPGTTFEPTLRHDPQIVDDQFVCEFQGLLGVV